LKETGKLPSLPIKVVTPVSVLGMAPLSTELFEFLRIQAGVPRAGVELTEKEIILEGNWEAPISSNKGCYPGQEVVERIHTYGQVNKKLQKVIVTWKGTVPVTPLLLSDSCRLMSLVPIPGQTGMGIGLAFLPKSLWESKAHLFTTSDSATQARLF
jgi:folate-binding protein YgfZ